MLVSWDLDEGKVSKGASSAAALRRLDNALDHFSGNCGEWGSSGVHILVSVASFASWVFSVMGTVGVSGTAVAV